MQFIVIIPFSLLVLAAILAICVISTLLGMISVLAYALFQLVCCVGAYRLTRTVLFGMYQRVYASAYLIWIGIGLILPSWGLASLTGSGFHENVRRITKENVLFFWTQEHMTFHQEPNIWSYLITAGVWIALAGVILFWLECAIKHPRQVETGTKQAAHALTQGAQSIKRSLDGGTANENDV
jgi:hypothetical protein